VIAAVCLAAGAVVRAQTAEDPAPTAPGVEVTGDATVPPAEAKTSWWRSALNGSRHLIEQLNDEGLYPQVKSFSDNTGAAPGIVYWRPRLGGTDLSFYASYAHSFRGDDLREVRFGKIPSEGTRQPRRGDYEGLAPSAMSENGLFYFVQVRQRDLKSSELYVPGASGASGSTINYQNTEKLYDAVAGYRFSPRFSAAIRAGVLRNDVGDGDVPLPEALADRAVLGAPSALVSQPDYFRTAAVLSYDDRDQPRNAHQGTFVMLTLGRYADRAQGAFSFNRLTLDARRFQPLFSPRHTLAVRLLTSQSFADAGAHVPFYLQDTLGGSFTMRGYPSFRFRGDKLLTLSTEYRFDLNQRYQLAAFYDAGKAWDNAGFSLSGLKSDVGLGVRVKASERVLFRLDVARGSEGTQVHLKLGYAF
jgi:hypothetical protein